MARTSTALRPSNPALTNGPMAQAFTADRATTTWTDAPSWPDSGPGVAATLPDRMTLNGTILKTGVLLGLLLASAMVPWFWLGAGDPTADPGPYLPFLLTGLVGGLVMLFATIFRPQWAHLTAPGYALFEGLLVGAVSALYASAYEGIVSQAVLATIGVAAGMLLLYSNRIITVTDRLRRGVIAATFGIMAVYLLSFVMRLFGASIPLLHDTGPLGIGISLLIVGVAAFNLLLDFDYIERGVRNGAPKHGEWYGAFGLVVTLVWLYLELLRLLAKLRE